METAVLNMILGIAATFATTLIGVFGAWLTAKIGQGKKLDNIQKAKDSVIADAQLVVEDLQQTVVEALKASHGGKLTPEQIAQLNQDLLDKTKEKMSVSVLNLLLAAQVDIDSLIKSAGESWVAKLKVSSTAPTAFPVASLDCATADSPSASSDGSTSAE